LEVAWLLDEPFDGFEFSLWCELDADCRLAPLLEAFSEMSIVFKEPCEVEAMTFEELRELEFILIGII
jgi:hypothetical protein